MATVLVFINFKTKKLFLFQFVVKKDYLKGKYLIVEKKNSICVNI